MKSKIIFFSIFSFLMANNACKSPEQKPQIGEEQLVRILADIHEAETGINTVTDYTQRDSAAQVAYSKILKMHKVTMAAVDTSLAVYVKRPADGEALYEKVQHRISMDAAEAK
jgi:Domain of unknown function (DUF4296)